MSGKIIFEQPHRGHVLRLEIADYKGSRFANFREWYHGEGDVLAPTKRGVTIPLDCLPEIHEALGFYLESARVN